MPKSIYLCANWKMYLDHSESVALAKEYVALAATLPTNVRMMVFPSALAMVEVSGYFQKSPISLGAQNIFWVDRGGYTGEVSAPMYKMAGCEFVLVGHSERRHVFHETNSEVRKKLEGVLAAGLISVLCVGDTKQEHETGVAEEVIEAQLRAALTDLVWPAERELIIAYEPVWAISSSGDESCVPEEAKRMADLIHKCVTGLLPGIVSPVVLYGGSVRPDNVRSYLNQSHIQGVLVGAAATNITSWREITASILK